LQQAAGAKIEFHTGGHNLFLFARLQAKTAAAILDTPQVIKMLCGRFISGKAGGAATNVGVAVFVTGKRLDEFLTLAKREGLFSE
jgi:hypothetical protein